MKHLFCWLLRDGAVENTRVGPFLILQRLGANRRQRVYRARQTEQNIDVALKFLGMPDAAMRAKAIDRIQIETDILKELHHPNLVQLLGAGVEGEQIFFASELVKGESLTSMLSRRGKFAADQVVDYGRQISGLLIYLHDQDIIHAKLTPDKILVGRDGVIKVADLRLNRSRKRRWDSPRQRELDMAAYLAPEQFSGEATAKSDIYSLGIILYEMLTGKLPYEPDTMARLARKKMHDKPAAVSSLVISCPVWLDELVCRMISPDPRMRPHSAKAVALALKELERVDASQTAAVSQVSGGFNPLTAGRDKTEANRILGKQKRKSSGESFFQSFGFLAVLLVTILAVLVFAMWPASSQTHWQRAQRLMQSDNSTDWIKARDHLKKIIGQGPDEPLYAPADELYFESRRRTLVMQAERGRRFGLQSVHSSKFVDAVALQQDGELAAAHDAFENLVNAIDPQGNERHILVESSSRLKQIRELQLADVRRLLVEAMSAESGQQIEVVVEQLESFSTDAKLAELDSPLAAEVDETLEKLRNRLETLGADSPEKNR